MGRRRIRLPPSTPGAAGGETAEFGGIYEVESPSQSPQESPVYQDPDAKLVRRAELYVETTEFDQAAQQLNEMVNQAGGYFESAAVEGGSYRNVNANRYGSYVIRVPEDAYTGFCRMQGSWATWPVRQRAQRTSAPSTMTPRPV